MDRLRSLTTNLLSNVHENKYYAKDTLIGIAIIVTIFYGHSRIAISSKRSRIAKEAQLKKEELLNKKHSCFDKYKELIKPEIESKILSMSASEIRENIINNKILCIESILVICYNTYKCNKKLNAILEEHYDSAYHEAMELDKLINKIRNKSNKEEWIKFIESKPLLGIPISVKDLFIMKGSDCTIGLKRLCNKPYQYDGTIIKLIRDSGGIPYLKSNCPQLNMLPESCNHIIGYTNNPYNINNVAGGSSGGEAALIACNASKLGIGTDIGGSLRMPANFCGCIAYKPSSKRSPQTGKGLVDRDTFVNKFGIRAVSGPLAMNMDDIIRFLKIIWSPKGHNIDPYMLPIPFRENIFLSKKKLKIGFWKNGDGWFTSTQCVKRGISEVIDILQTEYEYELIELPFNDGFKALIYYFKYVGAEANLKEYLRALDDTEELFGGFKKLQQIQNIPYFIKNYIIKPILPLIGEHRKYKLLSSFKNNNDLTMKEFKDICREIMEFKYNFWNWLDSFGNIDCIICPTNFYPAPKHNFSRNFMVTLTSTILQNILDCSSGCYSPVTFVNKNECHYNLNDLPENEKDSYSKELDKYMKDAYGLPIGVQIFSKPYNDEIVLRVMNDLDKYYKNNKHKIKPPLKLITHTP